MLLRTYRCLLKLFKAKLTRRGRYDFPFHFIENMVVKLGFKKGSNIGRSTRDRIDGPAHHNYYERKRLQVAHRAINHLNEPFAVSCGFIPWLKSITGIPETNVRRWQKMLRRDPMWRPWHTYVEKHKRIFSDDEEAILVSSVPDKTLLPV
jgi:hypothetical protein